MRRRAKTLASAAGFALAVGALGVSACGLDLTGTLGADGADGDAPDSADDARPDRTLPLGDAGVDAAGDGASSDDAAVDVAPPVDAPVDAPRDAPEESAGPCARVDGGAGILCGAVCVDPLHDHDHCGGCAPCNAWAACELGVCVDVAAALQAFRYEQPCDGATPFCATGGAGSKTATLTGTTGASYQLSVRVRGVVEQKSYVGSSRGTATGTNAGFFAVNGTPAVDGWNIYSMIVAQPSYTAYFNAGMSGHAYVDGVDYTATMKVAASTTLTLGCDPRDGLEAPNVASGGGPIVIPGIPPAPAAFGGQFLQLDVTTVKTVP